MRRLLAFLAAATTCAWGCGRNPGPGPTPVPDAPKIACPASVSVTSSTGSAIPVAYGTATTSGGAAPVTVSCTPGANTLFPIGTTTVTCTATDARQRTDSCTFAVAVAAPAKIQLTQFVSFGDSITAGDDGRDSFSTFGVPIVRPQVQLPSTQTYPGVLRQQLIARYTTQSVAEDNAGASGELASMATTPARFSTVVGRVSSLNRPYEAVLLMEGSNDVNTRDTLVMSSAIANLRSMVRDAKTRGLRPYLATIPPMIPNTARGTGASFVAGFNAQIQSLASAEGATLVDVYNALNAAPTQYIGVDGLHPTVEGYAKIADAFFSVLKSTLEVTPTATATPTAAWSIAGAPQSGSPGSTLRRRP